MAVSMVLLDTNAYAGLLAGDRDVLAALANADRVLMSVVVLGELYAGFRGGSRRKENEKRLMEFLRKDTVKILEVSSRTSRIFGEIKHRLKRAGTPVPTNDIWIAAHAMQTGATLVTYDGHFASFPGLLLWDCFPQAH